MKIFFDEVAAAPVASGTLAAPERSAYGETGRRAPAGLRARLAVYDSVAAAPRTEDVSAASLAQMIEELSARSYGAAREMGGSIPYTAIREIVENLVHASFSEVIVTVLDGGATIRFSDQGPGIRDKERAFLPGFSTATMEMKRVIRGVGSGLPIVRECLSFSGGEVTLDDNLGRGTVVTLRVEPVEDRPVPDKAGDLSSVPGPAEHESGSARAPGGASRLTTRQKQVLSLVMELGSAGPTLVARELGVGLSTAYRDLALLEDAGMMVSDEAGKRALSSAGAQYMEGLFASD